MEEETEAVNIGGCLSNITELFYSKNKKRRPRLVHAEAFSCKGGESRSGWRPMKGLKVKTANSKPFGADTVSIMILHTNWDTIPNFCIVCLQNT